MGKNHCISGVNWASMKKFAKFVFGEKNVVNTRIKDDKYYIIYIEKEVYEKKKAVADKFENEFLVILKPMED